MNRITAPMVLIVSALLVACSSCSSSTSSPTSTYQGQQTHQGQQSAAQLKAAALVTSDLPFGWAVSPPSADSSVTAPCSAITADGSKQLPAQAEADFQQSEDGPFLQEILASGPDTQVRDLWSSMQKTAIACSAPMAGSDSTRVSATTFPSYGDASYALHLAANRSGVSYGGDVVVIRKGQMYIEVAVFGVGGVSASLVQELVGTAVHKASQS
ncbi:uncharacterized protein YceK [Catenulispora sp. GP43]|uniref:hypothetical protein n=1 Tax=Catenulispora sp. GP43 TaxID=3156263 RepID=UPI0035198D46